MGGTGVWHGPGMAGVLTALLAPPVSWLQHTLAAFFFFCPLPLCQAAALPASPCQLHRLHGGLPSALSATLYCFCFRETFSFGMFSINSFIKELKCISTIQKAQRGREIFRLLAHCTNACCGQNGARQKPGSSAQPQCLQRVAQALSRGPSLTATQSMRA